MKDRVKTKIPETEFVSYHLELVLAVITNQCAWKIGPNRQVEELVNMTSGVFDIHHDLARRRRLRLRVNWQGKECNRSRDDSGSKPS